MRKAIVLFLALCPALGWGEPLPSLFFGEVREYVGQGKTASGEPFKADSLTAAHRNLPFGTMLRVVNLENNKQVVLRINDRVKEEGGFVLELTRGAAAQLGMAPGVVAKVEVSVLQGGAPPADTPGQGTAGSGTGSAPPIVKDNNPAGDQAGAFTVQVGAFRSRDNATTFSARLRGLGFPAAVEDRGDGFWRVGIGPYRTRAEAGQVMARLAGEAPAAFIREKH